MALGTLTVNEKGDGFLCDGKPWFWLADTCWSAFTSITLEDWDYYLTRRAEQGINTLQINTLPQSSLTAASMRYWEEALKVNISSCWSL